MNSPVNGTLLFQLSSFLILGDFMPESNSSLQNTKDFTCRYKLGLNMVYYKENGLGKAKMGHKLIMLLF